MAAAKAAEGGLEAPEDQEGKAPLPGGLLAYIVMVRSPESEEALVPNGDVGREVQAPVTLVDACGVPGQARYRVELGL